MSDSEVELSVVSQGNLVMASVVPKEGAARSPCDVVCVVDVSGSMGAAATLKSASGQEESTGLCVLDVVKHALKTIVAALDANDRLAVVAFSDRGDVRLKLMEMNGAGKTSANSVVDGLRTGGSTNIWDGLLQGLEVLRLSNASATRHAHRAVLLLTDGEPVVVPEGGHLAALLRYKDAHGALPGIVSTFGFGYSLDSILLRELSEGGQGSYAFIPDSSFTGTVFVHALAALQCTVAADLTLSLEPDTDTHLKRCLGTHGATLTSWGAQLRFGSLLGGQRKDSIAELDKTPSELTATLKWRDIRTGKEHTRTLTHVPSKSTPTKDDEKILEVSRLRLNLTEVASEALAQAKDGHFDTAVSLITALAKEIKASPQHKDASVMDMLKDVEGQMKEAVSKKEYYDKWGRHYLPSLQGAHLAQQCNNFKDPGVQRYVSALFTKLRDVLDETFLTLPPPKPSAPVSSSYSRGASSSSSSAPRPVKMSSYYSSGNPCFAGSARVHLANGATKAVEDIRRGDLVASSLGRSASILCVVKTLIPSARTRLVTLASGLRLTPYHPVRVNGEWKFPCDVAETFEEDCDAVYSFLLTPHTSEHVMIIDNVECVTLAHGFSLPVVAHAYFGTDHVLQDLQRMPGFTEGQVDLVEGCVVRDERGSVIGLKHKSSAMESA